MAEVCSQCGTALEEGNAFCTKCGAHRGEAGTTAAARRFCTKCGTPLGETKFCTKCGAPADVGASISPTAAASAPVAPAAPASTTAITNRYAAGRSAAVAPVTAVPASATPAVSSQAAAVPAQKSPGIPKVVIAVAAILLVVVVAGIAGVTYVVHRVRQKPPEVEAQPHIAASNAGVTTAAKAGSKRSSQAAVEDVRKQLEDLLREAPDNKTWAAVNDLRNKLDQLDIAARRDPNNAMAEEDLNKSLPDITAAATRLTPAFLAATDAALTPPPVPSGPPMVPVAGTGDPKHDWPLEYERTVGGPEADLVVRTGDINNLGFGWPSDFDPFSGKSTPPHPWPSFSQIPPQAPPGTDRIMLGTGVTPVHMSLQHTPGKLDRVVIDSVTRTIPGDGYSGAIEDCYAIPGSIPDSILRNQTTDHIQLPPNFDDEVLWVPTQTAASCTRERQLTMPTPIVLDVGELPSQINSVVVQIFVDDFQAAVFHSYFQVSLNGTRIPTFESVINSLDQSGPIGKLVTMSLLPEYWPLLKSGTAKLLIDDPTTHVRDGYAVDFVRILVNPHKFNYQVSLTATVTDADKHTPIPGATVSVGPASTATDQQGKCELKGIPAGLVVATANAPGYDANSVPVDLPAGQAGHADIQLHAHQESTAALEKSIAQTGTATIYGIHFDTGSAKLRGDSLPALNAVLGLINGRPGSTWIIAGHTDNQGTDKLNIPLSKSRAASVISWLTAHGVASDRLQPQGFGATRPVADNATANGRALNRRVEVSLAK
jgi:OmpA-OmpF porin, OOP family